MPTVHMTVVCQLITSNVNLVRIYTSRLKIKELNIHGNNVLCY